MQRTLPGAAALLLAIGCNLPVAGLAAQADHPDILSRPSGKGLTAFAARGAGVGADAVSLRAVGGGADPVRPGAGAGDGGLGAVAGPGTEAATQAAPEVGFLSAAPDPIEQRRKPGIAACKALPT